MDAGLDKSLVNGDPKAPRFVYWANKLRATPSGLDVLTFDLLSIWGKLRAGLGAAGIKKQSPGEPAHGSFGLCMPSNLIVPCHLELASHRSPAH